jgi:hydrogenase maturation protein HypF
MLDPADVTPPQDDQAIELVVQGIVQGVGFRPFVHRLAATEGLRGWVRNSADGVHIALFGGQERIARFKNRLGSEKPPLARIDRLREHPILAHPPRDFLILESAAGDVRIAATPDAGLCVDCRRELFDPGDRRFQYAFLNCTHCGPRFSIIRGLPYDRTNTSMRQFGMCAACSSEYRDVSDRRFHAQPIACADCGPSTWLEEAGTERRLLIGSEALADVQRRLRGGEICAIKGIGGFHLACSALSEIAVSLLRARKQRPAKPFAVMVRDSEVARKCCEVSEAELELLSSPAAPIVLLDMRPDAALPTELAPGLSRLGVMLPYSPLHALLMAEFDFPIVLTSGNAGQQPQVIENDAAHKELASFADTILMHDRDIINRVDDSLVQTTRTGFQVLRRGRGYAPKPMPLPPGCGEDHPQIIALGGDIKNAFAIAKAGNAVLSQHIGDLTSLKTMADLMNQVRLYEGLYNLEPGLIVADLHGGFHSTRYAEAMAGERCLPLTKIAHHHAHAAACMTEHGLPLDHPPILAVVQDGIGLGEGGELWGAELLMCDYRKATRVATLKPAPLPGGDKAAREPWRNLMARLADAYPEPLDWPAVLKRGLAKEPVDVLLAATRAGLNAPACSSAGRLFDAVAAALGLCFHHQDYEGEAAMRLQAAAESWLAGHEKPAGYSFSLEHRDEGLSMIDPRPIWQAIAADLERGTSRGEIAARFHVGWADIWCAIVKYSASFSDTPKVVLSGGVFQNRLLASMIRMNLASAGYSVLEHSEIPANDGGLALGQLAVALARHRGGER